MFLHGCYEIERKFIKRKNLNKTIFTIKMTIKLSKELYKITLIGLTK
jgi:hypothetical protein